MSSSVVFIHGLWIHSLSWQPWQELFEKQGYQTLAPGWPGDGETVAETRARAERMAGVGVDAVVDSYTRIIERLGEKPILVGHSFGNTLPADESTQLYETRGAHKRYAANASVELHTFDDRGHSAPFDHDWRELADDVLAWLERHES